MTLFNPMSCSGWVSTSLMGGCSQTWLVFAFLTIIVMVMRRQTDDGILAGVPFFFPGAIVGAALGWGILVMLTGMAKWALLAGLGGLALGGFVLGYIGIGGGGSE